MKQRNHGWRKIDTWNYPFSHPTDPRASIDIEFDVSMNSKCEFSVSTSDIPAERFSTLQGNVLADLREQAEAAAIVERTIRHELSWSQWLAIRVGAPEPKAYTRSEREGLTGGQVMLSYHPIVRAQTPDGQAFTPSDNNPKTLVAFPINAPIRDVQKENEELFKPSDPTHNTSSSDLIRQLSARDLRDGNYQYIYLPDTPQTREGLDAIIGRIRELNTQMHSFLSPDAIESTLARALQGGGLPLLGQDTESKETGVVGSGVVSRRGPGR